MDQVFAYKLLMNAVQVVNLALVWWLLGRVFGRKPRARLTAFIVFAWNPLMLFDAAGNAHNDALMVTLLLLGVVPLVWHRRSEQISNVEWSLGTLFVGMSALIKYTTGLVGPVLHRAVGTSADQLARACAVDWRHQRADRSDRCRAVHSLARHACFRPDARRTQRQVVDVHQLGT